MSELALFGTDLFGEAIKPKASGPVAERFTLPPFTILDARTSRRSPVWACSHDTFQWPTRRGKRRDGRRVIAGSHGPGCPARSHSQHMRMCCQ